MDLLHYITNAKFTKAGEILMQNFFFLFLFILYNP